MEERIRIHLGAIESIKYARLPPNMGVADDAFSIEFRDGKTITFKVEDLHSRNAWMDSVEESFYILSMNPIPAWANKL